MSLICRRVLYPFSCLLIFCLIQCVATSSVALYDYNQRNLLKNKISDGLHLAGINSDKHSVLGNSAGIVISDDKTVISSGKDGENFSHSPDGVFNSSSTQEYEEEEGTIAGSVEPEYRNVLEQYREITSIVDFVASLQGRNGAISFQQFSGEDLTEILYLIDDGYSSEEISEYMTSEKVLDRQISVKESPTGALPLEISIEVLSALSNGIESEKILEQFDIALDEKILNFSSNVYSSNSAPYKVARNLLRSLSDPAYDKQPGILGKLFWYSYGLNNNTVEFSRVAHALIPGLFDKFWNSLKENGLDSKVEKLISADAFSAGDFGSSCVSTIYLITYICNALEKGVLPDVISGLLQGLDKSPSLDKLLVRFYERLSFVYRNYNADCYLLEHKELLQLSEFAKGSLGLYLESLLRSGISNAFKQDAASLDDCLNSVVESYKEVCKILEPAVLSVGFDDTDPDLARAGINQDVLFDAIAENKEEPGITDLTKGTADVIHSLIEILKNKQKLGQGLDRELDGSESQEVALS